MRRSAWLPALAMGRHHRPYDLLIVQVGGIDALQGTPLDALRVDLLQVIGAAASS